MPLGLAFHRFPVPFLSAIKSNLSNLLHRARAFSRYNAVYKNQSTADAPNFWKTVLRNIIPYKSKEDGSPLKRLD